ncbi:MAG: phosphatidate cytidylyltransferase [candidate division Zixibacteria bacterium]|nr:phosphatidate cytidylyltransferase [candidate division Zixibacteria bacterium]
MSRNLTMRTIVAAIFGPLIILISYSGGYWLMGMIVLFAGLAMLEYMANIRASRFSFVYWLSLIFLLAMVFISMLKSSSWGARLFVVYFLLLGIITALKRRSPEELFRENSALVWGVAYLGLLYPFVYYIRKISPDHSGDWLLFLFGTIWLSDTLAMWIGKTVGKRKLTPTISPNKTVEGCVAGLFGGIIVACVLGCWRLSEVMLPLLLMAGLVVSMAGQLGDLVESVWKRAFGIKDASAIIPGHGGILDRFDSLLFAAPILYWFLKYVIYR